MVKVLKDQARMIPKPEAGDGVDRNRPNERLRLAEDSKDKQEALHRRHPDQQERFSRGMLVALAKIRGE